MRFERLEIEGAYLIEPEEHRDERGTFARVFSVAAFKAQGLETRVDQAYVSRSVVAGTLRGMHYQEDPHGEVKLIRCTRGAIFDAAIDLRPESPTFRRAIWIELTESELKVLYLPVGLAHGFLTLADHSEVTYQMSAPYVPKSAHGVRYNDPAFDIPWPRPIESISERDRTYPNFSP